MKQNTDTELSTLDKIKFRHCFEVIDDLKKYPLGKRDHNEVEKVINCVKEQFFDALVETREKYPVLHGAIKQIIDSKTKYLVDCRNSYAYYHHRNYENYTRAEDIEVYPVDIRREDDHGDGYGFYHSQEVSSTTASKLVEVIHILSADLRDKQVEQIEKSTAMLQEDKREGISDLAVDIYRGAEDSAWCSLSYPTVTTEKLYQECVNNAGSLKEGQQQYMRRFISDYINPDRSKLSYNYGEDFESERKKFIKMYTMDIDYDKKRDFRSMDNADALKIKFFEKDFAERYGGKIDLMSAISKDMLKEYGLPETLAPQKNSDSTRKSSQYE